MLGTLAGFALDSLPLHRPFDGQPARRVADRAARDRHRHRALNSGFHRVGIKLSLFTLVVAHATFCIVIVFNNVVGPAATYGPSVEEASADLGADIFQTFRFITFPLIRTALLAGGLLAFALSFDEIIVTTFTVGAITRRCRCGSSPTCSGRTTSRT